MSECCECVHCKSAVIGVDVKRDEIYEEGFCSLPPERLIDEIDQTKECEDFEGVEDYYKR